MRSLVFVLSAVACLTIAPQAQAMPPATPVIQSSVADFVRPAYMAFHASTSALAAKFAELCNAPSEPGLEAARKSFAETVAAWSRVEIIRFGPVTENNRLERILFWPDRKGTGLKQVQAALAGHDASATDAATLSGKSAAMQGLGALDFILAGTGADALTSASDPYRCAYGKAVAQNIDTIAGDIDRAWSTPDGIAFFWANPRPDNPLYRDDGEALGELLDVFVNGLELVRDVRMNGFLGVKPGEDKPKQALFWRSGLTVPALAANFDGLSSLFTATGFTEGLPENSAWIAESIRFEFANVARALATDATPVADLLADPAQRGKLDYARVVTSSLSDLFGQRIAAEFGITAGFSSLDGD